MVCCSFSICAPVSVSVFQSSSLGLLFDPAFLFWGISTDSGSCMVGQSCSKLALTVAGLTWGHPVQPTLLVVSCVLERNAPTWTNLNRLLEGSLQLLQSHWLGLIQCYRQANHFSQGMHSGVDVTHLVECLPSMHQALGWTPSITWTSHAGTAL